MHRIHFFTYLFLMTLALTFGVSSASYAADDAQEKDSKQAFIKAWEDNIKAMPTTVIFEKTAEKDVYNFETTMFPYKGKLKVLNIFIDAKKSSYFDYDEGTNDVLKGVAEIALDQTEDELSQKYQQSYNAFSLEMFLYYEPDTKKWISQKDFFAYRTEQIEKEPKQISCSAGKKLDSKKSDPLYPIIDFLLSVLPFVMFSFLIIFSIRMNKKNQIKYNTSIEVAKESVALQKEQVEILRKILEKQDQS